MFYGDKDCLAVSFFQREKTKNVMTFQEKEAIRLQTDSLSIKG